MVTGGVHHQGLDGGSWVHRQGGEQHDATTATCTATATAVAGVTHTNRGATHDDWAGKDSGVRCGDALTMGVGCGGTAVAVTHR